MLQIPSVDWPRRSAPLVGTEDLLKQNPISDAYPQEERVPTSLISDYTISQLLFTNVGSGIGVYDFKNLGQVDFRSIAAASNKIGISLSSRTIRIDANPTNIAAEISLTDLSDIVSPSNPSEYLMWDGSNFVFNAINPYALTVTDYLSQVISLNSGDNLNIYGNAPIYVQKQTPNTLTVIFDGTLSDLQDVSISGSIPDGYVLTYELSSGLWKPYVPATPPSYSFDIKGDDIASSTVNSSATVSILGNGSTITSTLSGTNEISLNWTANLADLNDVSSAGPLNNQILTYNSTSGEWEPKNAPSSSLTFNNGLTLSGSNVKLGGILSQITIIDGNSSAYPLSFINLQKFEFSTARSPHTTLFQSNMDQGITLLKNTKTTDSSNYSLNLDSTNEYASLEVQVGSTTTKFKIKATQSESSVFYESASTKISGVTALENRLEILDGVNTPSAGHVLTYMADGSTQYQPSTSGSADDWGSQVVEHDSTLTGDGTLASTLKVAVPVPSGYSNGQYLSVVGGVLTWENFPQQEFIGICEVQKDSEVSVLTGKSFFVVPPQMSGWELKSYIASVYVLGSGGTTDIELTLNGSMIANSDLSLSTLYDTKSSINAALSTGDVITLNVTAAKTTKDKGLSLTLYLAP